MRPDIRSGISDAELSRRWAAIREAMVAENLDAIVMQASSDWVGGYVRWFTDIPATNGYPRTVVFYRDGPMSVIEMGGFGSVRELDGKDDLHRGIGRLIHAPSFVSVAYTNDYDAALLVEELQRTGVMSVGLLAPGALPYSLVSAIRSALPSARVTDASDLVDTVKAVKSVEEIALIRQVATLQDRVFAEVCDFIRPGLTDIDLANHAQSVAHRLGSDQGVLFGLSAPMGRPSRFGGRYFQGRTISPGDHFSLLIEVNGPGGMYLEIARTMVLGQASDALLQAFDTVHEAQRHTLSLLRPGESPAAIAEAHDNWMRQRGLPVENRVYAHGQGQDMVERPLIRRDETMPLVKGMCLAVHPGYDDGELFAVICDNYLLEEGGAGPCLHSTAKQIFELRRK